MTVSAFAGQAELRRRWLEAATDVGHLVSELGPGDHSAAVLEQAARRARSAAGAQAAAVVVLPEEGHPLVQEYDGPPGLATDDELVGALERPTDHVVGARLEARLGDPVGLVLVLDPDDDPHLERDLLAAYADWTGLALDRSRAERERAELAAVRRRERIARELHDTVVQRLFAAGLLLQVVREASAEQLEERLDAAVEALDAVIREIRGTVLDLRG